MFVGKTFEAAQTRKLEIHLETLQLCFSSAFKNNEFWQGYLSTDVFTRSLNLLFFKKKYVHGFRIYWVETQIHVFLIDL